MKKHLPEVIAIALVMGLTGLFAFELLTPTVGDGGWNGKLRTCLVSVSSPDYEAASEVCDKIMTATAQASVTPVWWQFRWHPVEVAATPASSQFWLHPIPTTFFSAVTPVPTAAP